MNKQELKQLIKETKGKFFTLEFIKLNGDTRVVNAKNSDIAHIVGSDAGRERSEKKPTVSVFDRNKGGWVSVYPEKVKVLSCGSTVNYRSMTLV